MSLHCLFIFMTKTTKSLLYRFGFAGILSLFLYYFVLYQLLLLQVSQVIDNFEIYHSIANHGERSTQSMLGDINYIYGYYPPGSKFMPISSPLAPVLEIGRAQTISLLLLRLQQATGKHYGNDLDQWFNAYAAPRQLDSYHSFKEYREEVGLEPPFLYVPSVPAPLLTAQPKTQGETTESEE